MDARERAAEFLLNMQHSVPEDVTALTAAIRAAENDALERAVTRCEMLATEAAEGGCTALTPRSTALRLAGEIRSLKEPTP